MNIYLVRHGNYSNPDNIYPFFLPVVLSQDGIEQIQRVGEWLKKESIRGIPIYSSPIKRCVQTAEIISKAVDSSITMDDRLIESYCPNLQGKVQPEDKNDAITEQSNDPSREPLEDQQKRMRSIFDEKVKEGKDCVLVSHGDPITSLYYYLMKLPLVNCLFDDEHFDVYIKRAEIVKVAISQDKSFVVSRHSA